MQFVHNILWRSLIHSNIVGPILKRATSLGNVNLYILFGGYHGGTGSGSSTWRDKSLCFDLRQSDLELEHGEQLIACFFPIEDIKGNQDELGLFKVTNLRLIWICCDKKQVNLSIGWRTISLTFQQNLKDSLGSSITSLCVLSKYESTKYEFVFNKVPGYSDMWDNQENWNALIQLKRFLKNDKSLKISHLSPMYLDDPFDVIFKVWQSYKQTHLFRHCRSNLTHLMLTESTLQTRDGMKINEINKLPSEETIDLYTGIIQYESRHIKFNGTLILTNIRLIWIDEVMSTKNLSIPYIRIDSVKIKQNNRIIINTHDYLATSNQIELRTSKMKSETEVMKTKLMFEQVQNLYTLYKSKPRFGPESCDDVINIMSHLRPIQNYFESLDESTTRTLENLGPEMERVHLIDGNINLPIGAKLNCRKDDKVDMLGGTNIEQTDNELTKYSSKLNEYLNEQPIERDKELTYSRELGLAVERPDNNVDLGRIWRIEL